MFSFWHKNETLGIQKWDIRYARCSISTRLAKKITLACYAYLRFHFEPQRQRTLRLSFGDCRSFFFYLFIIRVSEGLLGFCDKQNNTWLLVDMKFLLSCSTRHLTRSLRSLVSYWVKHSKRHFLSTCARVLSFSIYDSIPRKSPQRITSSTSGFSENATQWGVVCILSRSSEHLWW